MVNKTSWVINWYRVASGLIVQPLSISAQSIEENQFQRGDHVVRTNSTPSFLTGQAKVSQYHNGIYGSMHYRFQQTMRSSRLMIMSGYGWGDVAINFQIESWLDNDKNNKLVLLYADEAKILESSKELAQMQSSYVRDGRIFVIPKYLCNTSINEIWEHIQV